MTPKKQASRRGGRRKVGLLGQPAYDSEEDEDWQPDAKASKASFRKSKWKRGGKRGRDSDEDSSAPIFEDDGADEPELPRRREDSVGGVSSPGLSAPAQGRRRTAPQQPGTRPVPGRGDRGREAAPRARSSRSAAGLAGAGSSGSGMNIEQPRDWGGLTAAVLEKVLRRACAASAVPAAAAAACVCQNWRQVCDDIGARAIANTRSAVANGGWAAAQEAAAAAAALSQHPPAAAGGAALPAPAPGGGPGSAEAGAVVAAVAGVGDGTVQEDSVGSGGNTVGLWACLDVRSRPTAEFNNQIIRGGAIAERWLQVRTLRLSALPDLTAQGLVELARSCPALTALELSQCDDLIKKDAARDVVAALPRLRLLEVSHCAGAVVDSMLRIALAARPAPALGPEAGQVPAGQQEVAAAEGQGGGSGGGGSGRGWALPCPLRVLRARGCARVGPATFKALAPEVPTVTLPPSPAAAAAATSARPAGKPVVVPLLVHLRELDLTGSGALLAGPAAGQALAIERLQQAAPNLRVLRLDAIGSNVYMKGLELGLPPSQPGPGFPRLRLCELGLSRAGGLNGTTFRREGDTLELIRRVVGRSPRLRCLDVSGATSREDRFTLYAILENARLDSLLDATDAIVHGGAAGQPHHISDGEEGGPAGLMDGEGEAAAERRRRRAAEAAAAQAAAAAEAAAVATAAAVVAAGASPPAAPTDGELEGLRARLRQCLPVQLSGPLRVLRASKSVLASDAGLHALAARFGGTLQIIDVSESANVTDAGLLHVARSCTALTSLDVSGTAITDWGVWCLLAIPRSHGSPGSLTPLAATAGRGGPGGSAGPSAAAARIFPLRLPVSVVDLVSDTEDDDSGDEMEEETKPGGQGEVGGAAALALLNIRSCRGVARAVRHAADVGLVALRKALGL